MASSRNSTGYTGVRERPSGMFTAEIRAAGLRQPLGTFLSAEEAARAYDASAWVLGRPRRTLNFHTVETLEIAVFLAEPSPEKLVTADQRRRHRQTQRRIRIAQEDESAMADRKSVV